MAQSVQNLYGPDKRSDGRFRSTSRMWGGGKCTLTCIALDIVAQNRLKQSNLLGTTALGKADELSGRRLLDFGTVFFFPFLDLYTFLKIGRGLDIF